MIEALKARGLWEASRERQLSFTARIECPYNYTDDCGSLLYQVVRLHSPKNFRQRYPDGRSGWTSRKHKRQMLYRLAEIIEAPILFVVEGEKDVETSRDWGFVATSERRAQSPWPTNG